MLFLNSLVLAFFLGSLGYIVSKNIGKSAWAVGGLTFVFLGYLFTQGLGIEVFLIAIGATIGIILGQRSRHNSKQK